MILETSEGPHGYCWCHAESDLGVAATGLDGLCDWCRGHSPSACKLAHTKRHAAADPRGGQR